MVKDNKLIAEFMGLDTTDGVYYNHIVKEIDKHNSTISLKKERCKSELTHFILLKYHTSWDWLMPVVQKCLDVSNDDNIEDFYSIQNVVPNSEATYKAVVEFIKQLNKES